MLVLIKNYLLLEGIKILIAEDNLINQKIANYLLSKQGANIVTAYNGREAIRIFSEQPVDIILMDLQMPVMDGFEATKYIRTVLFSDIPIIALTADLFANSSAEYLNAGFNDCISKPFESEKLCDLILKFIKNKHPLTT